MSASQALGNDVVLLEPASEGNVDLLVRWTLDPVAQGPYKRVPEISADRLRELFLREPSREYFLVRMLPGGIPVGRLYWRAWRFTSDPDMIDWELNSSSRNRVFVGGCWCIGKKSSALKDKAYTGR
jgi:hypothetical protein